MAQSPLNDTTQPVDGEEEDRSLTTDRQWLIEKKLKKTRLTHIVTFLGDSTGHGSVMPIYM